MPDDSSLANDSLSEILPHPMFFCNFLFKGAVLEKEASRLQDSPSYSHI
jgi:hypothetical protein